MIKYIHLSTCSSVGYILLIFSAGVELNMVAITGLLAGLLYQIVYLL